MKTCNPLARLFLLWYPQNYSLVSEFPKFFKLWCFILCFSLLHALPEPKFLLNLISNNIQIFIHAFCCRYYFIKLPQLDSINL